MTDENARGVTEVPGLAQQPSDFRPGTRVRLVRSPWPAREGCTGIVVAPRSDGIYPQPPRWERIVLLDDDPLLLHAPEGIWWSCCIPTKNLVIA